MEVKIYGIEVKPEKKSDATESKREQHFVNKSVSSVQFSSVTQSCPTLGDPMNCSTPGLPVHHQLPEFTQTHMHGVGDAIQPSHPLSSPSPPAPNPSQHQGLFQCIPNSTLWEMKPETVLFRTSTETHTARR